TPCSVNLPSAVGSERKLCREPSWRVTIKRVAEILSEFKNDFFATTRNGCLCKQRAPRCQETWYVPTVRGLGNITVANACRARRCSLVNDTGTVAMDVPLLRWSCTHKSRSMAGANGPTLRKRPDAKTPFTWALTNDWQATVRLPSVTCRAGISSLNS